MRVGRSYLDLRMFGKRLQLDSLNARIRSIMNGREPVETSASVESPLHSGAERSAHRVATYRHAEIVLGGGETIRVAVKNASETGVRVDSYRILDLPEYVSIRGVGHGELLSARVVWQERHSAALQFIDRAARPSSAAPRKNTRTS